MSEGKRPGGLTALAVINFVFGGFGALGLLGMAVIFALVGAAADAAGGDEATQELAKAWEEVGVGLFYLIFAMSAVNVILLIASGVGYLGQKKVLGRMLGNAYAILSIIWALVWGLVVVNPDIGGGFNIGTIVGLVYPVLTLILLNTTFKEDLVR